MIWFDTFKAKLASPQTIPSSKGNVRLMMPNYPIFTFTKDLILFPKVTDTQKNDLSVGHIYNKAKYTLRRLTRHEDGYTKDAKFQAIFNDSQTYNLRVDIWNGILLRIIHKRYSLLKHWEWYWKTILAILFGAVITYFVTKYSYRDGFKDGYKNGLIDRPHG